MQRTLLRLLLALALVMTLSAADLTGTWKGSMETPQMGTIETTIMIQSAAPLAGTVKTDHFEAKMDNAKLDGDKVSFEINIEQGKVSYEGTIAGDELKLNVTGTQGNKYVLNCRRQK